MGWSLIKKNSPKDGFDSYKIAEILVDTEGDLRDIPVDKFSPGSIAYTADRSVSATLNTKGEWVNHVGSGSGGSGSGGGIPTAIIKQDGYDNALMGVAVAGASAPTFTCTCTNMTYEEAKNIILSGQPLNVIAMTFEQNGSYTGFASEYYIAVVLYNSAEGSGIAIYGSDGPRFNWTSDGLTMEEPK